MDYGLRAQLMVLSQYLTHKSAVPFALPLVICPKYIQIHIGGGMASFSLDLSRVILPYWRGPNVA